MNSTSFFRLSAAASAVLLATGCATMTDAKVDMPAFPQERAIAHAAPPPAPRNGAIFQAAGYRPLFEDHRARQPGDALTIQIQEVVSASQQSTTKVGRNNSIDAGISAFPFASARTLGRTNVEAGTSITGDANGQTGNSSSFTGVIAVTVREVLPNGNLVVAGDKQIGINGNVDTLRFTGVVDPKTIRGGNVVSSTQVADARLEQKGRGDVGRVQGIGWLPRFFLSVLPLL